MSDDRTDADGKRWRAIQEELGTIGDVSKFTVFHDGSWVFRDGHKRCVKSGKTWAELDAYLAEPEPVTVVVHMSVTGESTSRVDADLLPGQSEAKTVGDITVTIKRDEQ